MPVSMQTRISLPKLPTRDTGGVPRSQAERLWMIGGGLIAFVLFLIGYFFFISPERSNTSDVNSQVASTQQQNSVLQAKLNSLRDQSKNLAKYEAELQKARLALPATSGVPDFLRSLQALGNTTHTDVTALSVGEPAPVVAPVAAEPTTSTSTDTTEPAASATTAPAAAPAAAAPAVYSLAITATVSGSPTSLINFLDQLQSVQPRALLITDVTQTTGAGGSGPGVAAGGTTLSLTMQAFVAPDVSTVPSPTAPSSSTASS